MKISKKKRKIEKSSITSLETDNRPIAFFDSGVGGLPYLSLTMKKLPGESYVYLCDRKNFPYGDQDPEDIKKNTEKAVALLLKKSDPKLVVIACNTASVVALSHLRHTFSVPFVGVVPAVKPAALKSLKKKIGVLATSRTVKDSYLKKLITEFAPDFTVVLQPGSGLVELIEYNPPNNLEQAKKLLKGSADQFNNAGVDSVVLGCTHFIYIIPVLRRYLNPDIDIIDSREGVANQIVRLNAAQPSAIEIPSKELFHTGSRELSDGLLQYAEYFGLDFRGSAIP